MSDIFSPVDKLLLLIPKKWHLEWSNASAFLAFPFVLLAQILFTTLVGIFAGVIIGVTACFETRCPGTECAGCFPDMFIPIFAILLIGGAIAFLVMFVYTFYRGMEFLISKQSYLAASAKIDSINRRNQEHNGQQFIQDIQNPHIQDQFVNDVFQNNNFNNVHDQTMQYHQNNLQNFNY